MVFFNYILNVLLIVVKLKIHVYYADVLSPSANPIQYLQ